MSLLDRNHSSFVWEWHDGSIDRAQIRRSSTGFSVTGRHGDTRYIIELKSDFTCHRLEASHGDQTCNLKRTPTGWQDANGKLIAGSDTADDLDLGWSAITNTFPICRMMAQGKDRDVFDVLLVNLPDLQPKLVLQSYTRNGELWTYQNQSSGFTAQLDVDSDGAVVNYPDLCTRKD